MNAWWQDLPYWFTDGMWTMATGAAASIACALLGVYLVLRRLSLLGDAISHAVLPGLVLAFLWTGSRHPVPMLLGAMAVGILTALLTQTVHRLGDVPADSSMGVVFTTLFAIGVILITIFASQIDLDPGCVLYGLLELVVFDTIPIAGFAVPRAFVTLALTLLLVLAFITIFWKELKICAFDGALATSMGISAGLVHYVLMAMVAATTVASFEAVGSILVIAMLIAPAATAHLLTDRLGRMMLIASAVGVISTVAGYLAAVWLSTMVAGMIAVAAGVQFALAALFAPRYGVLGRAYYNFSVALRILREDILAELWRRAERGEAAMLTRAELLRRAGGGWPARLALRRLVTMGWLDAQADRFLLSPAGAAEAGRLIRAHRLWESFAAIELGSAPETVDPAAHRVEHFIGPQLADRLTTEMHHPALDPHGKPIPDVKSEK